MSSDVVYKEESDDKCYGPFYGKCKWFNNKYGYGFITVLSGDKKGKEIFAQYTGIKPMNSTYKTILNGEYVNFDIIQGIKDLQAVNITGINGGPLMCDTNPNIKYIFPKIRKNLEEGGNSENKQDTSEPSKTDKVTEGIIDHCDGICKWFNDISGYGFLVIETGQNKGKDVFVHYSGITPQKSSYKSLVSGEYITFDLINGQKGLQAVNVTGYKGDTLMCDMNHIPKTSVPKSGAKSIRHDTRKKA